MSYSIVVDKLKRNFVQQMFDEAEGVRIGDSDNQFYIAVGRSQVWNPDSDGGGTDQSPIPKNNDRTVKQFRYSLQSAKAIEGFAFVVPIISWTAGSVYNAYNDNVVSQTQQYYVRTTDNNIYVCLRTGKTGFGDPQVSTIKPDHTNNTVEPEIDGYVWKYLYSISTQDVNKFLTTAFMPVRFVDSDYAQANPSYATQYAMAEAAQPGQILGYRVTDKGGPYTDSDFTITVVGNGTNAKARPVLNASGGLEAVEVGDSANAPIWNCFGSGYDYASVSVGTTRLAASGTSATVVPIFGPENGIGFDPRADLRSTSIMYNIKPVGDVDGTFVSSQRGYRQYGLIKNPTDSAGAAFTETSGIMANRMRFSETLASGSIGMSTDKKLHGTSSGAVAWMDFWDDSDTLWYHQDETTGFTAFDSTGETVQIREGASTTNTVTMTSLIGSQIDNFSGEVLFISNGDVVVRDAGQTEDIKVVIKL